MLPVMVDLQRALFSVIAFLLRLLLRRRIVTMVIVA
jgi:hypothetical protein